MDKTSIINAIQTHQPVMMTETAESAAVVAMLLYDPQDNLFLIVTKRSDFVATYAGDYCFPGGAKEQDDLDYKVTAIREVYEELGIEQSEYQLIGQLDDFVDRFNNLVRPFVAMMSKENFEAQYHLSQEEVAKIIYLPIQEIAKIAADENLERLTRRHPTYRYEEAGVMIWGLTASMMVHLGNIIFDLNKPVGKKVKLRQE